MRSIKSKIISLILCVAFTLTLWPISSFAAIDSFEDLGNAFSGFVDVFTNFTEQLNNASTSDVAVDGASSDVMTTETGDEKGETSSDETESITFDYPIGDKVAESTDPEASTAVINKTSVNLYRSLDSGALGMVVSVEEGTEISLVTKYTFTLDDGTTYVFYRYDYTGDNTTLADAAISEYSGYPFISAEDITVAGDSADGGDETTDELIDETGIKVSGNLPTDADLTVVEVECSLDESVYSLGEHTFAFDISLGQELESPVQVIFPVSLFEGVSYGAFFKCYHILDTGEVEDLGIYQYVGEEITITASSFSEYVLTETTDGANFADFGTTTQTDFTPLDSSISAWFKDNDITLYAGFSGVVDTLTITGFAGESITLTQKITYTKTSDDGTVTSTDFYFYTYEGTNDELYTKDSTYYTICADDIAFTEDAIEQDEVILTDDTWGITVTGNIPDGVTLKVEESSFDDIDFDIDTSFINWHDYIMLAYDISLQYTDENNVTQKWNPEDYGETVTVTIPNAWDPDWGFTRVDVYHDKNSDGEYDETNDGDETFSTIDNTVTLYYNGEDDYGITFTANSFSDYFIVSSESPIVEITGASNNDGPPVGGGDNTALTYNVYMVKGSTATMTIASTPKTFNVNNDKGLVTLSPSKDTLTTEYTITAGDTTSSDIVVTYSIFFEQTVQMGRQTVIKTFNATVNVYVYDKDTFDSVYKDAYLANTVNHLQIDIESTAVALGYNDDEEFSLNLGFSDSTKWELDRVEDDSEVGFYYVLTYSYTDSNGDVIPVTITVRVDESATDLPEGITFADIGDVWFVDTDYGICEQESQVTFGNKDSSSLAQFPVGTSENPIIYTITVETEIELTPNEPEDAEATDVEITVSNNICYWDDSNECPGQDTTSIKSQSGMDLGSFSTGAALGENKYAYVLYSDLTKIVRNYAFGTSNLIDSKNYVFTVYVRPKVSTGENTNAWTAIDTINITVNSDSTYYTETRSLTTDANKYVSYFDANNPSNFNYEFKIVETGKDISGYSCDSVISQIEGSSRSTLTDGLFTWTVSTNDNKTYVFSVELECTNTYTEKVAGIKIIKNVENSEEYPVAVSKSFKVRIQPTELEISKDENGTVTDELKTAAITQFLNGSYSDGTKTLSVTAVTGEYGYIDVKVSLSNSSTGQITVTGLPAGEYKVWEIYESTDTSYDYDKTIYTSTIDDDTEEVVITNIIQNASLTITKAAAQGTTFEAGETFIFNIVGDSNDTATAGINMTVVISCEGSDEGSVTINDLPIGTYTVTEDTSWSWRYALESISLKNVGKVSDETNGCKITVSKDGVVTFTNKISETKWLDDSTRVDNVFTTVTGTTEK